MIKKALFFVILLLNTAFAFAQNPDSLANKPGKIKNMERAGMSRSNTIMTNISSGANFSKLANAIQAANLSETFNSNRPITIFAPDDKAFEKMAAGKIDTLLLPPHKAELANLLL